MIDFRYQNNSAGRIVCIVRLINIIYSFTSPFYCTFYDIFMCPYLVSAIIGIILYPTIYNILIKTFHRCKNTHIANIMIPIVLVEAVIPSLISPVLLSMMFLTVGRGTTNMDDLGRETNESNETDEKNSKKHSLFTACWPG